MIKAIIFDLGNVTIKFDETSTFKKWASCGKKSFDEVKRYYQNSPTRKAFERGEITPKRFYDRFVKDLGLKLNYDDFKENYCNIFTKNAEVEEIIKALKGKVKLILLSNTNVLQYEFSKRKFKIINEFDYYVLSYKVGLRKPNPSIFLKAVKQSGFLPFNCAYFDDIREFIFIARFFGIKAFQYRNIKKLKKDLKSIGVLI